MKDTGDRRFGLWGGVFVIQVGFFLQGESASNLIIVLLVYWCFYWFLVFIYVLYRLRVVVATLDLEKEQVYQTQGTMID